ncbi:MAG TPA: hypothetical protein DHW39_00095 [Erysipelotrichaceae bacterium]|nr:hypothetical protein [Erysipelotrichaceae bacterium]
MEILKEKGTPVTIFGNEYSLTISLKTMAKIEEALGDLTKLMLNYKTIPTIVSFMVDDYCDHHPEAKRISVDEIVDGFDVSDVTYFQKLILNILNPEDEPLKNG